jgi:hypothetical protein
VEMDVRDATEGGRVFGVVEVLSVAYIVEGRDAAIVTGVAGTSGTRGAS